jgi:hypothetical protein
MIKHLSLIFLLCCLFGLGTLHAQIPVASTNNQDSASPAGVTIYLLEAETELPLDSVLVTWSNPNKEQKTKNKKQKPASATEWANKVLTLQLELKWPERFEKAGYEPGYLSDRSFVDKRFTQAKVYLKKKKRGVRLVPVK